MMMMNLSPDHVKQDNDNQQPVTVTPKLHKSIILDKYRENATIDNIENEIEGDTFKLIESPVFKNRNIDFIHSPFQLKDKKNDKRRIRSRPVLGEPSFSSQNVFEPVDTINSRRSSVKSLGNSKSRKSSLSSSSPPLPNSSRSSSNKVITTSSSCEANDSITMAQFRNITPLNFEDLERMQLEDTPLSRGSNRNMRSSNEFQFKKPLSHQKIRSSIEDKVPMLYQHKTPSNSRSTSPIKQFVSKQQQQQQQQHAVSLTPAQRVEKHAGRLFSNAAMEGKSALDNYEFKELLGKGASANVYRAINLITGMEVAIKQIEINTKDDIELMMTEIRLLKILRHNNIVKYHGYVNNGQNLNIILEYCSGGSLRKLYKQRKKGLEEHEIIRYTREILKGLVYLHEQGVIHRDVKLANVLLTADGTVKLADFGVSSRANHKSSLVVGGSPYWMAPEVILLQGSCTASDIWSLGATVVELFTTQPPYHEFDPMAACHAIGMEDSPPIPANIPKLAKEFLVECFQKSPEIRIDAKRLLQHPWLNDEMSLLRLRNFSETCRSVSSSQMSTTLMATISNNNTPQQLKNRSVAPRYQDSNHVLLPKIRKNRKVMPVEFKETKEQLIGPTSPFREIDEEPIDEKEFENLDFTPLKEITNTITRKTTTTTTTNGISEKSHDQLLNRFNEEKEITIEDRDSFLEADFGNLQLHQSGRNYIVDEEDPFLELEDSQEEFVDPGETKLISKVESWIGNLDNKNDHLIEDLDRLILVISEKEAMGKLLVRNHGLIRLLELLDGKNAEIAEKCLQMLNTVFLSNCQALENFCVIGGITSVVQFSNFRYPKRLRMEVVKFIELIISSNSSIFQMFIACGGLKILIIFVEEDFDSTPEFVSCGVDGIHAIFTRDLPTSRSDFCYLLKDSVDWLAVNLSNLVKDGNYADKIVTILQSFNYCEPRVKSYIATTTLFKSIFGNYEKLSQSNKLKILKFISSLSSVPTNLNILDASNCLSFLVLELLKYPPPNTGYKEIANAICPTIFNLCHLNKIRQLDLVELNAVPVFAQLAQVELPFKDFIIPILSELVLINSKVRKTLWENHVFEIFTGYLVNPYWQVNSLDAIKNWLILDDKVESELIENLNLFIKGFKMTLNLNFLQDFLELISLNKKICQIFSNSALINEIFNKLLKFLDNAIIELTLLKILKKIITDNKSNSKLINQIKSLHKGLIIDENSVLVTELIKEIDEIMLAT